MDFSLGYGMSHSPPSRCRANTAPGALSMPYGVRCVIDCGNTSIRVKVPPELGHTVWNDPWKPAFPPAMNLLLGFTVTFSKASIDPVWLIRTGLYCPSGADIRGFPVATVNSNPAGGCTGRKALCWVALVPRLFEYLDLSSRACHEMKPFTNS
jgi:hypothetical protein